jgi:uncharacterized protein YdhG (YjbR/CyaY superfamily)
MVKALPKNLENLYLKSPKSQQKTMLEMRKRILEIIPSAEEVISYGMPAFKYRGTVVAGLLSNKNHVGFYPFSGSVLALFREDLKKFKYTKSALHVPVDKPLSKTLLNKLIKARISQCSVKQGKIKLEKYQELDGYWREIGIAAPARRGLVDNKIYTLVQLKKWSEKDFMKIHAMGPSAAKIIKAEMKRKKVQFK